MKKLIRSLPVIGPAVHNICRRWIKPSRPFTDSEDYWVARYASGGNSGAGSYGQLSIFKAAVLNDFVLQNKIPTVIEYGCGDGNQLRLARYPSYLGFDVSHDAVSLCRKLFARDHAKQFKLMQDYQGETACLTISLDVIYHLIEDQAFFDYIHRLFDSAESYVIIYSSDTSVQKVGLAPHVRHRKFTESVQQNKTERKMRQHIPNRYPYAGDDLTGSFSDFYIYEKSGLCPL